MAVRVVTDSTSDLPPDVAQSLGVTVVPCYITFGTEDLKDGVDLSADQFYERLVNGPDFPKTSQPSVGDFKQVYEEVGPGSDGIVSVHVSSKLSGTYNSATQAVPETAVDCPIEVVDTYQASLAVGLIVRETARIALEGGDFETVARVARETAERSELVFVLDTLEYLEKGGRVGKAAALLGGLLRIRPLIILRDGVVDELAKARSRNGGIERLLDSAREFAPADEIGVVHTTTPDDADALAARVRDLVPGGGEPLLSRAGPTIGTYAGPGALGIALVRSEKP
jgi:DegV family protein with EDD domain